MDISDIEPLLIRGEFRNLDFKESHILDKDAKIEITKDLLAFANTPGGGKIIIGVKENKDDPSKKRFEINGLMPEHRTSWTHDNLADTARNYADPFIEFEFEDVLVGDKVCIVIKIQEFEELPVICKKPFGDILKCGAIYARSYVKRESAEVRSQSEIRDILNMATEKSARKFIGMASRVGMPLTLSPTDSEKFEEQLQEFLTNDDQVKAKIKSKGYWEIVLRPSKFIENRIPELKDCVDIIRDSSVHLRGWSYPHFAYSNTPRIGGDYVEQSICFEKDGGIEEWRYYQSGQFAQYLAVWEDWSESFRENHKLGDSKVLNLRSVVYQMTEIFDFSSKLGTKGYLGDLCQMKITLHDNMDRSIVNYYGFSDPSDISTMTEISYSVSLAVGDLVGNPGEHALVAAKYFFERFNWLRVSVEGLKPIQDKILAEAW